jgi:endoribonuclease Dicer
LRKHDPDFGNISTQYTVGKIADPTTDTREAELEHKKQEDVLKRFYKYSCDFIVI